MSTDAQKAAKRRYAAKIKRYVVDLYPTDADMAAWLERQERPQTYIKQLIRKAMEDKNEQSF